MIRPPCKILVKESSASDLTPTTTLTSTETTIPAITQCTINNDVRMVIRDKTYLMVKFIDNDQMATRIIILLLDTGYRSQSCMRKYYMRKKKKPKLAT